MSTNRVLGYALIAIGGLALLGRVSEPVSAGWGLKDTRLLETKEHRLDLDGVEALRLEAGAGSLRLLGQDSGSAGRLAAEFHGPDESALKDLRLEHRVEGRVLVVTADTSRSDDGRIDLELELPSRLALEVTDGSGSAEITGFDGPAEVTDGSGSLSIERMGGALTVTDGSGSLEVAGVEGPVTILDGSGSLDVSAVKRSLEITDGSGSIDVERVGGDLSITDGSGSIQVSGVDGDVSVTDGSGSIEVREVGGRFRLLGDGSGSVSTSGIRGGESI